MISHKAVAVVGLALDIELLELVLHCIENLSHCI